LPLIGVEQTEQWTIQQRLKVECSAGAVSLLLLVLSMNKITL